MQNNRNFFITIVLSVLILTLWQVFYMGPKVDAQREAARIEQQRAAGQKAGTDQAPGVPAGTASPGDAAPSAATEVTEADRAGALAATKRVRIDTPALSGSINLTGARFDDLRLKDYRETVEKDSPNIELLNPWTLKNGYYAELGFTGAADLGALPGPDTVWTVEGDPVLTPSTPVTMTFVNDRGLTFRRTISVDAAYMFDVADTVENAGPAPASLNAYGRVTRFDKPHVASAYVIHEGLIGVVGEGGLEEVKYAAIEKDKEIKPEKASEGWLGITDKYWAVALVPAGRTVKTPFQPRFAYFEQGRPRYQADYVEDAVVVAPGQKATVEAQLFAGAKEVERVQAYADERHIKLFDRLIDWGWFWFLTKPMFWLMDHLYKLLGNFGLAILATTVVVKTIFFPLANKSFKSMANMKKVQPKLLEIREKYADDKMKQQQAMMQLYKEEKINPVAGCLPMVVQIPVFFALYKVIYVTIEMRHAPFFGWIQDLAAPDPTSVFNLFGLLPFAVPHALMIGVWPLIMGITMFLQMRMNPAPPDPTQAMIFNYMPIVFTFMLAQFPAGLVIYWAWNNTLTLLQQGIIMKRQGARIELWDNLAGLVRRKKPSPAE